MANELDKEMMGGIGIKMMLARDKAGLTREQLSERAGVEANSIYRYETGKQVPSFNAENEDGKIVKKYLLPNFVASCCKKIGIEGVKYKSAGYNCCVLWKDDYFEFVEGSREII